MNTEITCLCCEGQDVSENHQCCMASTRGKLMRPICRGGKHYGFCRQCVPLLVGNFENQMRKPKLRIEGEKSPD